jgi:hypothetical protein
VVALEDNKVEVKFQILVISRFKNERRSGKQKGEGEIPEEGYPKLEDRVPEEQN